MKLSGILREPLVHFLLIGLLLFLLYGRVAPEDADSRTIEVSAARVEGLSRQFQAVWNRPPTQAELRGLIDSYVRDEVLYREGLAMGLDGDDPVIKRRVRQKLDVITEETGNQAAPTDAELSAYLAANPDAFRQAPVLSFEQIFFSGEASVAEVERRGRDALAALAKGAKPADLGQPSLLPARVERMPADLVARDFGEDFAKQVTALPTGVWQGPIASGLGAHLVRVSAREAAAVPALAAIRPAVSREWENARRERNRAESYRAMADNYRIVIDGSAAQGGKR